MVCGCSLRGSALLAAVVLLGALLSGCGGSSGDAPQNPATVSPPPTATGTLTVSVADPEGQPLADARVSVFNSNQTRIVGESRTSSTGVASIDGVPAAATVAIDHEFGDYYHKKDVSVAQQGVTYLAVTLEAYRPRPTVALLPVAIVPGSVNADRSELTLEVTVVASAAAPFAPAGYGDYSPRSTPAIGLALDEWQLYGGRQCLVWLDDKRTVPSCGVSAWGDRYTVSVEEFAYDPAGSVPTLATPGPAASAMLVMDQSDRVAGLDPLAKRSFAARQFIARSVTGAAPLSLAVAGLAGAGNGGAALPEQPLWVPAGSGTLFSTDRAALEAAVGILEPLVGGSAPVFDALETALTLTATQAPPGNRAVVALLGGGDGVRPASARQDALAALRRQRDDAGIQAVVIAAAPDLQSADSLALADLAAALRAPAIALSVATYTFGARAPTWTSGVYAALDLAADLLDGAPLPSLSASFRVKANQPNAFPAGATLRGAIFIETEFCPMGCIEIPLEFTAEIP